MERSYRDAVWPLAQVHVRGRIFWLAVWNGALGPTTCAVCSAGVGRHGLIFVSFGERGSGCGPFVAHAGCALESLLEIVGGPVPRYTVPNLRPDPRGGVHD